ncbi:hypothetical protein W97_02770 [Coniosporium apollinis CBS 100218]|uniref:Uncharacterized protein n=1 Tax=Coniosporium apollinis (strain CBS 100218) TaxID=1168221 RepID=R7YNS8_CONA1|nr:uncharacterized protein W97_02770 [Coniosporium apollinis CBS 100218]EON63542.1 hypothetical protein W97_02770 [Coniosporium apollinis CBS 100218]
MDEAFATTGAYVGNPLEQMPRIKVAEDGNSDAETDKEPDSDYYDTKTGPPKEDNERTLIRRVRRAKDLGTEVGAAAYSEEEEQFRLLLDLDPINEYTEHDLDNTPVLRRAIKLLYRERMGQRAYTDKTSIHIQYDQIHASLEAAILDDMAQETLAEAWKSKDKAGKGKAGKKKPPEAKKSQKRKGPTALPALAALVNLRKKAKIAHEGGEASEPLEDKQSAGDEDEVMADTLAEQCPRMDLSNVSAESKRSKEEHKPIRIGAAGLSAEIE